MMPETNLIAGFWTPAHFAELTGGTWLIPPRDAGAAINGISIDSRGLAAGQGFVAIRGERFDGHRFLAEAATKGAALAIVEQPQPGADAPMAVLQVASTLAALQRLASHWRDRLGEAGCRIISVSGSNGKTTTRQLVHQVLTTAGLVGSQSPKSFNNHLGVPLTLLAARANQDFVVAEIGTNHPGEIAALASILRPDIALITSIGEEHLEYFHDLAGVAQEESQVFAQIAEGGVAIIPAREHLSVPLTLPGRPRFSLQRFDLDPISAGLSLPGLHNRLNASAASAVARCFGVSERDIACAWRGAKPAPMRGELIAADDPTRPTIINDAYNANPASMRAALDLLAEYPAPRWAVLGDMLELGDAAPSAHREIAARAAEVCDRCVLIGLQFAAWCESPQSRPAVASVSVHPEWSAAIASQIAADLSADATLLIKGSRGMALERLLAHINAPLDSADAGQP